MTRTLAALWLAAAGLAPAQTPATTPTTKPAPRPLLAGFYPVGGDVPGRKLEQARDGSSATFHITPAQKPDGKPATTLDQRRGHFALRTEQVLVGDFQYEAAVEFLTLPDRVRDGWGVCVGLGVDGPAGAGNAGINRGMFELTGPSYHICRDIPNGGGTTYAYDNLPSKSKAVRLGVRRQGNEVLLLAADGPTEPLVETRRYAFTDRPTRALVIYTTTGGSDLPLSARVSDVKLLAGPTLPPTPAKSRVASVVMVPPHDPVTAAPTAVTALDPAGDLTPPTTPVRGGGWGPPLAAGLAGLVAGTLLGRVWGRRDGPAADE